MTDNPLIDVNNSKISKEGLLSIIDYLAAKSNVSLNFYHLASIVVKYGPNDQQSVDLIERGIKNTRDINLNEKVLDHTVSRRTVYFHAAEAFIAAWTSAYSTYIIKNHRNLVMTWLQRYFDMLEGDAITGAEFRKTLTGFSYVATIGTYPDPSIHFLYDYLVTEGSDPVNLLTTIKEGFESIKASEKRLDEVVKRQWRTNVD